jgi:hypothetical protein
MLQPPRISSASAGTNTRFHLRFQVRSITPLHVPMILPVVRTTNGAGARL